MSLTYGSHNFLLVQLSRKLTGNWQCILLVIFGCLASLVMASQLWADPSPAVQYLMREPVSMLDWGLAQIEEDLYRNRGVLTRNDGDLFEPEPVIRVDYAWEEDRIQIFLKLSMHANVKKTPQRMTAVRQRVEFVNGFFLEPTVNLSGGEALAQMATLGQRWYMDVLGLRPRFAWMIDVCGVNGQMPQIGLPCVILSSPQPSLLASGLGSCPRSTWQAMNSAPRFL